MEVEKYLLGTMGNIETIGTMGPMVIGTMGTMENGKLL